MNNILLQLDQHFTGDPLAYGDRSHAVGYLLHDLYGINIEDACFLLTSELGGIHVPVLSVCLGKYRGRT